MGPLIVRFHSYSARLSSILYDLALVEVTGVPISAAYSSRSFLPWKRLKN